MHLPLPHFGFIENKIKFPGKKLCLSSLIMTLTFYQSLVSLWRDLFISQSFSKSNCNFFQVFNCPFLWRFYSWSCKDEHNRLECKSGLAQSKVSKTQAGQSQRLQHPLSAQLSKSDQRPVGGNVMNYGLKKRSHTERRCNNLLLVENKSYKTRYGRMLAVEVMKRAELGYAL